MSENRVRNDYDVLLGADIEQIHGYFGVPTVSLPALDAYHRQNLWLVFFYGSDGVSGMLFYDDDFNLLWSQGIEAITAQQAQEAASARTMKEVADKLGMPHTDVGSGLIYPAYLTQSGNLLIADPYVEDSVRLTERPLASYAARSEQGGDDTGEPVTDSQR